MLRFASEQCPSKLCSASRCNVGRLAMNHHHAGRSLSQMPRLLRPPFGPTTQKDCMLNRRKPYFQAAEKHATGLFAEGQHPCHSVARIPWTAQPFGYELDASEFRHSFSFTESGWQVLRGSRSEAFNMKLTQTSEE